MRMSQLLNEVRNFELDEGFSPKEIKMAIGIASDPRYAKGNMTGAVNAIEKMKRGLSKHPQVAAVLKRQNEDIEKEGFASDAQRRAAFASGYKEKDKKKKEEVTEKFSDGMIDKLRKAYEPLRGKKIPPGPLMKIFDKIDSNKDGLEQLYKADIPFVSVMAMSRLMLRHNYKATDINKLGKINMEEFELDEAMYHHVHKGKVVASGSKSDMMKLVKKNGDTIRKGADSNYVLNSPGAKVGDIKEETLDEEVEDIFIKKGDVNQIAMRVARTARSLGLKAALKDGTVRIMGPKKKVSDFMRITIGKTSSGDASTVGKVSSQDDKLLDIQLTKEEVNEMSYKPGSFKDTRPQEKSAKALADLAKTGGIDKKDFEKARALYVQASDPASREKLKKFIFNLDTEPKEEIMDVIGRNDPNTFLQMYPDAKEGEPLTRTAFKHRSMKSEEVELDEMDMKYVLINMQGKVQGYASDKKDALDIAKRTKSTMHPIKKKISDKTLEKMNALAKTPKELKDLGIIEEVELGEAFKPDQIQTALKIARDNRFSMRGMVDKRTAIEKIAKGLSKDPAVKKVLDKMYEEFELKEKYDLYHKDFSSAMQHAYDYAKQKMGITIDPKEIDSKVATGPKKPTEGKTNKYRLKGKGGNLQIQVYNKGGSKPFELNMYKEENDLISQASKHISHMQMAERKVDPADVDDDASEKDVENAAKNIIMQLRKSVSMRGNKDVEFADGKQKVDMKIAQKAISMHMKMKPQDKLTFQNTIAKSYKDLLNAVKGK